VKGLFLGLALGATLIACRDEFESHYPDVLAARRDGAFDSGWLPTVVPDDATDISEFHDIDTNVSLGCFTTSSLPALRESLHRRGAERIEGPIRTGLRGALTWWPDAMARPQVEAYRVKEDSRFMLLLGIDPPGSRVCFRRTMGEGS
jgi:hypothetical protein